MGLQVEGLPYHDLGASVDTIRVLGAPGTLYTVTLVATPPQLRRGRGTCRGGYRGSIAVDVYLHCKTYTVEGYVCVYMYTLIHIGVYEDIYIYTHTSVPVSRCLCIVYPPCIPTAVLRASSYCKLD